MFGNFGRSLSTRNTKSSFSERIFSGSERIVVKETILTNYIVMMHGRNKKHKTACLFAYLVGEGCVVHCSKWFTSRTTTNNGDDYFYVCSN